MRIAIYKHEGLSKRWVEYCENNNISYKLINPYDSDIVEQINGCDAFMWHHSQADYRDVLFAKQLILRYHFIVKDIFAQQLLDGNQQILAFL